MQNRLPVRILVSLAITAAVFGHIAQSQDRPKRQVDKFALSDVGDSLNTQYLPLTVKGAFSVGTGSEADHVETRNPTPPPSPCTTVCRLSAHKPENRSVNSTLPVIPITSRVVVLGVKR